MLVYKLGALLYKLVWLRAQVLILSSEAYETPALTGAPAETIAGISPARGFKCPSHSNLAGQDATLAALCWPLR